MATRRGKKFIALDDDTLISIFRRLTPQSLARSAAVCSQWHRVATSELLRQASKWCRDHGIPNVHPCRLTQSCRLMANHTKTATFEAHSGRVNCCHWFGETISTGSSDKTVKLWSTETMRTLESYKVDHSVIAVKFDANRIFAAAGADVHIWKRGTSKALRVLGGHHQRLHSMELMDEPELAVGCADGTLRILDMYTGSCSMLLRLHTGAVTCIGSSSKSNLLISGSRDCTIQLSDSSSGREVAKYYPSQASGISCMLMQESYLIVGTESGQLDCIDIRCSGRKLSRYSLWSKRVSSSGINSIHSPDYFRDDGSLGLMFLTGGSDGKLSLFTGRASDVFRQWTRALPSPVLTAGLGYSRCVSGHADGSLRWWKFYSDKTEDGRLLDRDV